LQNKTRTLPLNGKEFIQHRTASFTGLTTTIFSFPFTE